MNGEEHHSLVDPVEDQKHVDSARNVATNGYFHLHPGHHHTAHGDDHSPERSPLDESFLPKNLVLAKEDLIIREKSATNLIKEFGPHETSKPRLNSLNEQLHLPEARVLVLYTGGTIGMKCRDGVYCPEPRYLPKALHELPHINDIAYAEEHYSEYKVKPYCLPPVRGMKKRVVYWVVEYEPLLDSSDMTYDDWVRIAKDIRKSYQNYDGFVVLHGTDTMGYTASALSFMMENLGKPVVLTGSQIPVSEVRSDGRENLIGSLVVAGNLDIPEVCIYFNNKLFRGNRCQKLDNTGLDAFDSPNMAPIADMSIDINVHYESIFRSGSLATFTVHESLCRNVGVLRIFPSISIESVRAFLRPPTQGVVLQTFGAGNLPSRRKDIIDELKKAVARGVLVLNVSQCVKGHVEANYLCGKILSDAGVIPGADMTTEAALAKLAYVLGKDEWDLKTKREMLLKNLRGEITVARSENLNELDIIPSLAKYLRISSAHETKLLRNALFPPLVCHAASNNDIKLLESLRDSGANFSAPDYNLRTGLHVAAAQGHLETVEYLLKWGASVHARDVWDQNALSNAIHSKNLAIIKVLRDAGALLTKNPVQIGVELCLAASQCDLLTLKAWKEAGADLGEADYDGRTALHVAANRGYKGIVQYLCDNGADPTIVDNFGLTPMDEAKNNHQSDVEETLLKFMNAN